MTAATHHAGTSAEREVARKLGGRRIGQQLGPVDVIVDGYMAVQVKRTKGQPSLAACAAHIDRMPASLLRAVVAISRPGSGHRARRMIVLDFDEFCQWHGAPMTDDEAVARVIEIGRAGE
jgi:hypothetical protein